MDTKYVIFLVIFLLFTPCYCDITNLNELTAMFSSNKSYKVGFLQHANYDVVKQYVPNNLVAVFLDHQEELIQLLDNETIIAVLTTGRLAEDLEPKYHVFTSAVVSPQAMLLAPDYDSISYPYGLKGEDNSSRDLFDALNAAIAQMQFGSDDETLLTTYNRSDLLRIYTCRVRDTLIEEYPVVDRKNATGLLKDVLTTNKLIIGAVGPYDWGKHDGNYLNKTHSIGFYPELLDMILKHFQQLKGPDGESYGENSTIKIERVFYDNATDLFRALLDHKIHATDVYTLIDGFYNGTGEKCQNDSQCRAAVKIGTERCDNTTSICTHPKRPRTLHFRTTCTTASADARYFTKKNSQFGNDNKQQKQTTTTSTISVNKKTSQSHSLALILLFTVLFGAILITLLFIKGKRKTIQQRTNAGGVGKFHVLKDEQPVMDSFDDHVVQSTTPI